MASDGSSTVTIDRDYFDLLVRRYEMNDPPNAANIAPRASTDLGARDTGPSLYAIRRAHIGQLWGLTLDQNHETFNGIPTVTISQAEYEELQGTAKQYGTLDSNWLAAATTVEAVAVELWFRIPTCPDG
jgi:hypothetical protein